MNPRYAALGYVAAYALSYAAHLPVFSVHPVDRAVTLGPGTGGVFIEWYGYVCAAVLGGLAAGLLGRGRRLPEAAYRLLWLLPLATLALVAGRESHWFWR